MLRDGQTLERVVTENASPRSESPDRDQVVLAGKYLIEGIINAGEFAEVKMASDVTDPSRKYALKVYPTMVDGVENATGVRRARAEIESL